jgi:uncharacterized protein (TIGR02147 family)
MSPIPIFDYTNYRDFLRDYYKHRKELEGYTHRDFASETGMNSTAWLLHLVRGSKNLTTESAQRISKGLGFTKSESEYFENMVSFTQAQTPSAKDVYFQRMLAQKRRLKISRLTEEQYEYYSKWYHPVIRSLVTKILWDEDYEILASHLVPSISAREAKASVQLLTKLGLISRNEEGEWSQSMPILSTGDEVNSIYVANYHREVSRLSENIYDLWPKEERDVSSLTLGIHPKDAERIKSRIQEFRKEILEIARMSDEADRVMQLNIQFFPVSRPQKTEVKA